MCSAQWYFVSPLSNLPSVSASQLAKLYYPMLSTLDNVILVRSRAGSSRKIAQQGLNVAHELHGVEWVELEEHRSDSDTPTDIGERLGRAKRVKMFKRHNTHQFDIGVVGVQSGDTVGRAREGFGLLDFGSQSGIT